MTNLHTITARFIKYDRFENVVFLVSNREPLLQTGYTKASKYANTLNKQFKTNSPIFTCDKGYVTLRFKRCQRLKDLEEGTIYKLKFEFVEADYKGLTYCHLIAHTINIVRRVVHGKTLEIMFEDSDEDDEEYETKD